MSQDGRAPADIRAAIEDYVTRHSQDVASGLLHEALGLYEGALAIVRDLAACDPREGDGRVVHALIERARSEVVRAGHR